MAKIEHLVVLMFENASFDRVLGYARPRSTDYDGLSGDESNPVDPAGPPSLTPRLEASRLPFDRYDGYVTAPSPLHEVEDATLQIFGGAAPAPGRANNQGFVKSYRGVAPDRGGEVMGAFDRGQLPALTALADEFVVFDRWHASVPGPTWPNRFFAHCATSGGHSESPPDVDAIGAQLLDLFPMATVFESLLAVGGSWRVYYHDVPQSLALARLHAHRDRFSHVGSLAGDAARGDLPQYTFIEPAYFNLPGSSANDMHPPHDGRLADALVASVYCALRAGPAWEQTALLVLWDEHGGFFDHVPPPDDGTAFVAAPPDLASASARPFAFDRLGVRVPAILASAWAARGGVDHTLYEHCAIPATVRKLFCPSAEPLTVRDRVSATFDAALTLDAPRATPTSIACHAPGSAPAATGLDDLSGVQRDLVSLAKALGSRAGRPTAPATLADTVGGVRQFLGG